MGISDANLARIFAELLKWGPWGAAFLIFMIWGMPHVAAIISATGTIFNERHRTNLSHKRSMTKIDKQATAKTDKQVAGNDR